MGKLTIIGLSVCERFLSGESKTILQESEHIILQTQRCYARDVIHPAAQCEALDELFERAEDFDELLQEAAKTIIECAKNEDVVYAVPASALGLPILPLLRKMSKTEGITLSIIPGLSYGQIAQEQACATIEWNQAECTLFAIDVQDVKLNVSQNICIQELDKPYFAGQAKLQLMEYFPDDWEVFLAVFDEQTKNYHFASLPLYDLDRQSQEAYSHQTCLLVPSVPFEKRERYGADDLMTLLKRLRAKDGCAWDRKQTHESLRTSMLEECYEVLEAIDLKDDDLLQEELGDVLMICYFHILIATEQSRFTLRDCMTGICQKMIYRHPHVFTEAKTDDTEKILKDWEQLKRAEKGQETVAKSMKEIAKTLPALTIAQKLQKKAANVGFDWEKPHEALEKVNEESKEVLEELNNIDQKGDSIENLQKLREEIGDLLFSVVNVARLSGLDSEMILREANDKFLKRFELMEQQVLANGKSLLDINLSQMNDVWVQLKTKPLTNGK